MKIAIGADHGGFELKEKIKKHLIESAKFEIIDYGTDSDNPVDYPEIAYKVGTAVVGADDMLGILCCGTGVGISIAANKIKGIRAACCFDHFRAKYTRLHNDANILCLGGRVIGSGLACEMVDIFLNTSFEGGRHQIRVNQINEIENGTLNINATEV